MSSVQSTIYEFWERCISETMFLRGRCHNRPYLYISESGSLVLDARPVNTEDKNIIFAIYITCDQVAKDYGFFFDEFIKDDGWYIWQKGGEA